MLKKIADEYKENRGTVTDAVKTIAWTALIFDRKAVPAWARLKIHDMYGNKTLIKFLKGTESFFKTVGWHLAVLAILQVVCWVMTIAVLTAMNAVPGNQTKAVVLVACGLTVSFLIGCLMVFEAVKLHAALELVSAAKSVVGSAGNSIKHLLPSFLQFDWGSSNTDKVDGLLQSFRIPYKAIFWIGVLNIAMGVIACLTFGVFYGAILAAIVLDFALVGLGLKIGYNITSDTARIWAFRFAIITVLIGLVIVIIGPKKIDHWNKSKSVAAMKTDVVYNQRKAELEEANGLAVTIRVLEAKGAPADEEKLANLHEVYNWLLSDKANKGSRPTPRKPEAPTCSDGKDNNKDRMIDEKDPACGMPDSTCIVGYEVTYVKGPDKKPVLDEDGNKKVATRKPRLEDGCRMFEGYDLPRRYDSRLDEVKLPPPPPKPPVHANANNSDSDPQKKKDKAGPNQAPAPVATNRTGNAESIVLERLRAGKYRSGR
jgi:hypothetical protein